MIRRARPYGLLFLLLSAVYHANLRPVASGDSLPAALIPFSIVLDGSIALDRFGPWIHEHVWYSSQIIHRQDGHWYSIYPIAGPVLAAPFYAPFAAIPWVRRQPPDVLVALARIVEKFVAVALAAASAILLLLLLERVTDRRWAWTLTFAYALGTGNWSTSSQALWQHTFGQLAIVGCLYCLDRQWFWVCGICAGCALAIRPTDVALLPALALAARWQFYHRLFGPPVLAIILIAAYNYTAFDNVAGGYPLRLSGNFLMGLAGALLSPGRGLVIYTPLVLFALCAFLPQAREARQKHRDLFIACTAFALLQIAIVAKWETWWGGYCWGPRLLTEVLPSAMVLIALGVQLKTPFLAVAAYCFSIQVLGVFFYPRGHWDHFPVSVNTAPNRLWDWRDNPIERAARGGPALEPYAIVWTALAQGVPAAAQILRQSGINSY